MDIDFLDTTRFPLGFLIVIFADIRGESHPSFVVHWRRIAAPVCSCVGVDDGVIVRVDAKLPLVDKMKIIMPMTTFFMLPP
jgi:hypothetical protein